MKTPAKRVVLFGHGDVSRLVHFLLTHDSPFEVSAYTVDESHITQSDANGLPVVPFEDIQNRYPPDDFSMFIALGYHRINKLREQKYSAAKSLGYELISYVSPRVSTWPGVLIGDNCLVQQDTVLQPSVSIGNNVFISAACHIGFGSVIEDHCYLLPRVAVAGRVTIEPNCILGINSTIRDGLRVGRESFIGAGALIMKDTDPRQVYVGGRSQLLPIPSDSLPSSLLMGRSALSGDEELTSPT